MLLDLNKFLGTRNGRRSRCRVLRRSPRIEDRYLVHARDRAVRGAAFFGDILPAQIFARVLLQRNPRIASLLRAVMHQTVLADVQVTRSRAASPIIWHAFGNVVLKCIDAGEAAFLERLHLVINAPLFFPQRLQLPAAIVNNPDRRRESKLDCSLTDYQRVLRMWNSAADDRINIHVKIGVDPP